MRAESGSAQVVLDAHLEQALGSFGSSGWPSTRTSAPAITSILCSVTPSSLGIDSVVPRRSRSGSSMPFASAIDPPARRVAVVGVGDRGRLSPSRTTCEPRPGTARVVGLPGFDAPLPLDLSCAFSTWVSESLACARIGVPSGRKSMYWTLRLSATALNVTVLPQQNVTIGGRPLFLPLPEPSAWSTSIILKRRSVTALTSRVAVGGVEEQVEGQLARLAAAELRRRQRRARRRA